MTDETVQTQQNAEIDRKAARTSPEVRQGSQGLVSKGLEEGALVRRVVLRISQPPQLPRSGRQQLRSASRLRREASHQKARLGAWARMTHRVMCLLRLVP